MLVTIEQEKKALEKIEKILESLSEESYVAKAFEGCDLIAAENIDNDFWDSYKDRFNRAEQQIEKLNSKIEMLYKADETKADVIKRLHEKEHCMNNTINDLKMQLQEERNDRKEVTIELANGEKVTKPFAEIKYVNDNGFTFVTVAEKNGWMTSYKMEDIKTIKIA